MRQFLAVFLLVCIGNSLFAATKDDKKKTEGETVATEVTGGVVYTLPRTGIRVQVIAQKKVRIAGPYAVYAQKYLGIENVATSNNEKWELQQMNIETFAEPDPQQVYKASGSVASLLGLTADGLISCINSDSQSDLEVFPTNSMLGETLQADFPFTDLSMWGMYAKADSAHRYKMVPKTMEEKAAEAAETIFTLRNARFRLLTNADDEPLPDGKSFEVMAKELADLEREQLALFIGKEYSSKMQYSFDYIPGENSTKGEVIFRFAENKGVLPKTDLSGKPIIIDVDKLDDLSNQIKKQANQADPLATQTGVYYRLPGKAAITISNGVNVLATSRATIAQFGEVSPVPAHLLDGSCRLDFHPQTGAIKSVVRFE